MPWQPVAAKELGGRRVVVAHLPQRRLTLQVTVETTKLVMGQWARGEERRWDHTGPLGPSLLGPPRVGAECLQACLSRPGCRRHLRISSFLGTLLCRVGRVALGAGGSVLAGPPSIAWQQWGMVCTAGMRHESKGDGREVLLGRQHLD